MKHTSIFKDYAKYASLNVLGMLGLSCYILADTFFVSLALGADGLAALNLAIPVYSFIHGSGLMTGMGGGIRYSIFKSQGDKEHASRIFTGAALLTALIAALFFLAGLCFPGPLIRLLGAEGAVFQMGKTYLQVILLFAPLFMTNNLLLCFVRNDGAPQLSMAAMITGSLSNVVLDYVFMFPLGMGIFGAAFATGLAPVISILVLSPFFFKKKNQFHLRKCRISPKLAVHIFSSGLPSLVTEVSSGIVMIVFNSLILGLSGNTGVAAYGVIANLSLVVISIYTGISQGIQPLVSSCFGRGDRKNADAVLKYALVTVAVFSALIYVAVFFGAGNITAIFNSGNNPLLQDIAVSGLKIYFTGCVFAGCNVVVCVYFTSTDNPLPAHVVSLLRGFILIIPLAFLLAALGGLTGIWATFPVTELLVCLAAGGLLLKGRMNGKINSSS